MKIMYFVAAAALLSLSTPAFAQVAEADAESESTAGAAAGAYAENGDITFEASEIPEDVTVHTPATVVVSAPQSANPCALSRVGGVSLIDFGISLGDTWVDENCANLEQLRILDGIFNDVPDMQPVIIQMARNTMPEFDRAFMQVEQARLRRAALATPTVPSSNEEPQQVALRGRDIQGPTQ